MAKLKVIHAYVVIATIVVACSPWIRTVVALDTSNNAAADNIEHHYDNGTVHHGNDTEDHGNGTEGHDNHTDHHDNGHGVQLASIHLEYVKEPLIITMFLLVVALCKLGFHHANFLSSKIPESCLLIILGTIVGAILHFSGIEREYFVEFSSDLFFLYLLPPIILESAYSLHDRVFFDNLGTILLYAVIGTILNCFILSPTLYGLAICGAMGPISITLVQCFVFGALIVAVDPVAVLAIFQEVGVNNVLYFLVFGESLLNDAVTVVIYNTMKAFSQMDSIPVSQIFLAIGAFFTVSLGGLAIGILVGALCSFFTKYTRSVRVVEPLAIFSLAYASYLLAELFHFSGIISIIACGLMQAQYSFHNISHKSHTTVVYFGKMLSATCDCIIFMFLGLSLVSDAHVWHTGFVLWSIFLCLVIRFGVVYFLTFFANRFQRLRTLDWEEQFIMAYGGLRGAVAFSLVTLLDKDSIENQPMFQTTTLAVIIFTVFVQGITIKPLVKFLRIASSDEKPLSIFAEINCRITDHVLAGIEEVCGHYGHNRVREKMDYFDNQYLRQWLMRDPKTNDDNIMDLYEKIALQMHFENVAGNTMWTEYTSDYQLYKPELIDNQVEDNAPNADMAHLALDMQLRHRSTSGGRPMSRGMTIMGPPSPSPLLRRRDYDASTRDTDSLPRKSTILSDDVFVRSMDGSGTDDNRSSRERSVSVLSKRSGDPMSPSSRRRTQGFMAALKRTFSEQEDDSHIEEPSLDDIKRWLVVNPTRQVFHRKYDRNLTQDANNDLLHHLHEKQLRNQRRKMSMGIRSPTASPNPSPRGTPRGSYENISGRPQTVLNVISEGVPMATKDVNSSSRQPRYIPYRRNMGQGPRRLVKSATIDPEAEHQNKSFTRAKTFDESQITQDTHDGDTTPLLHHSPDGTDHHAPGVSNPEQSPVSTPVPTFMLHSDPSSPEEIHLTSTTSGMNENTQGDSSESGSSNTDDDPIDKSPSAPPVVIVKSPSGTSIKNRGHLARQKTTEVEEALPEEDESAI